MGCPAAQGPPVSTKDQGAAWEWWRISNYNRHPSQLKKPHKIKVIPVRRESAVALLWCSRPRLVEERSPAPKQSKIYTVTKYKMRTPPKRKSWSIYSCFHPRFAFLPRFDDFTLNPSFSDLFSLKITRLHFFLHILSTYSLFSNCYAPPFVC